VVDDGATGLLVPFGDTDAQARAVESLIQNPVRRAELGRAAQIRAAELFSADAIVPRYEQLYRRVCAGAATLTSDDFCSPQVRSL
jgi:glycosyltransferase involved in cell wall biosynthesis